MRFELVRDRLEPLPRELPEPPGLLTPVRIDAPDDLGREPALAPRRRAAVLVLLFPDDEGQARVLLTARVASLAAHAGEVSFPGGSAEPEDVDPVATALRETAEEVGLDPIACGLRVVGSLERVFVHVSQFVITPVLALAERAPAVRPAPDEVAHVIEAPVEAFLPDAPLELEERIIRERLVRYGLYPVGGERVWGATARVLGQLGALLARPIEPQEAGPGLRSEPSAAEPRIRAAVPADGTAIAAFLGALAPELSRDLAGASEVLLAELGGEPIGLAAWAPWEREHDGSAWPGFEAVWFPDEPAELILLAVAPGLRGRGIGRQLTESIAAAAGASGRHRLVAWTLADSSIAPSAAAARAFFRASGFRDLVVDRRHLAHGEERLLLERRLDV